jgi:hypothetical protein
MKSSCSRRADAGADRGGAARRRAVLVWLVITGLLRELSKTSQTICPFEAEGIARGFDR